MKIESIINGHVLVEQAPRPYSGKISPSSFGQCYRKQYWLINREEKSNPPDERTLRTFSVGDLYHEFVQGIIENCGYEIEVPYEDDVLSFRADAVCEDEVLEIKSVHSRSFWWMEKESKKPITETKRLNVLQVLTYAWKLEKKQGRILYISKDDCSMKEYVIPLTDMWIESIQNEIDTIKGYLDKKILPSAVPRCWGLERNGQPRECMRCNYLEKCQYTEEKIVNG